MVKRDPEYYEPKRICAICGKPIKRGPYLGCPNGCCHIHSKCGQKALDRKGLTEKTIIE